MRRRPHGLVALLLAFTLVACGEEDHRSPRPMPTTTPELGSDRAEGLQGTYDVTVAGDLGDHGDLVGSVTASHDEALAFSVRLSSNTYFTVGGTLRHDGTVALLGSAVTPRRSFSIEGQGVAARDTATQRIVGTVHSSSSFLGFELSFTFDRPRAANVTPYMGTHRFRFSPSPSGCECDSTATFRISGQTNGFERADYLTPELDVLSRELGVFDGGECLVTATGRLSCLLAYAPKGLAPWYPAAYFFGRIAREAEPAGTGRAEIVFDGDETPRQVAWTATRLGPLP
jgi:hypothetical protein